MRVLFYNHTGQVSGAERILLMILSRLDRDAFESAVICPDELALQEMVGKLGIPVHSVNPLEARFTWRVDYLIRYLKSFFGVIRQLRQRVKTFQPDLLHANSIRAGLVATTATLGLGTRVVWHLHDMLPRHPLSSFIRLFAALSQRTEMIAVSRAVAVNFQGRWTSQMKGRVHVVLNAIDRKQFPADRTARRKIRQELRFRETDLVVGIVGQLTPRKGQLELLRAFAKALVEFPNMVLLIAGAPLFNRDHEYLKLLRTTAKELGIASKTRLLGARDDIGTVMQSLDLLVVNSRVEPFGLVIPEAMVCNAPVLAAAVDGIPEIIQHRENGWLVPAQNTEALTEALIYLARRPALRENLAAHGKRHVAKNFSVERYLADLQKVYYTQAGLKTRESRVEATARHAEAAKVA